MSTIVIANAFSLSMMPTDKPSVIRIMPLEDPKGFLQDAEDIGARIASIVGHADTAVVFSSVLGRTVPPNRTTFRLQPGQILMVGQYIGPRLPEGATELPVGAAIQWMTVTVDGP